MGAQRAIQQLSTHGESAAIAQYREDEGQGWSHQQCYPCWFDAWGLDRIPVRYEHGREPVPCCFCGRPTASDIVIRIRPGSLVIPHCPDARPPRWDEPIFPRV